MIFNFSLYNHNGAGRRELFDLTVIMAAQLEALGHGFSASDEFDLRPGVVNVLFECFTPDHLPKLRLARRMGACIVIVATETPGLEAFNNGYRFDMQQRQAIFPEVARLADALWVLAPDPLGWYAKLNRPWAAIELGHAAMLEQNRTNVPEYDYAFYGNITDRRKDVLSALMDAGLKVNIASGLLPYEQRDELVASAKVVLEICSHDQSQLISSSRCATSLHVGRAVLCDHRAYSGPWTGIVDIAGLDFIAAAKTFVEGWDHAYARQMAAFKFFMTPLACLSAATSLVVPNPCVQP